MHAKETESRRRNIKIRVKAILTEINNTTPSIKDAILLFLKQITSSGSFVPSSYWQPYQKSIISLNEDGSTR